MFYAIIFSVFAFIMLVYLIGLQINRKRKKKYRKRTLKFLKFLVVLYCIVSFLSILLPDAFAICYSTEVLELMKIDVPFVLLRWFSALSFVVLPIAVFYKNRTIRNIAVYFCLAITVINIFHNETYLNFYTSLIGRGLNSIDAIPNSVKEFLINTDFRTILMGAMWTIEMVVICLMGLNEKHFFNFKDYKEYFKLVFGLVFGLIACIPIYVPQYIFGFTDLTLDKYQWTHFVWIGLVILEIIGLWLVFRKKTIETKKVLCMFLSLCLFMQFNQMFSAISIDFKRLPFQLCNIGAYLLLFAMMSNSKKLFDFTLIVNVAGVLFAFAMPSLDGNNIADLYNVHFVLEHTNLLVVPILANVLGVFPKLDRKSLKNYFLGFLLYFLIVLILGVCFNALASSTGNDFYSANYLFMFDKEVAVREISQIEPVFDIVFTAGHFTFYPVVWVLIYAVLNVVCLLVYLIARLFGKSRSSVKNNYKTNKI